MNVRILEGDCLAIMPTLDADSVDAVVCDPPYGLKFMGKEWDHGVPGVPFWIEALRVAKPGAYLLAFGGTRTHHRLTCAIEDAGWEIRDCLMWLHGQGFPKGKAQLKPAWEPIIMARKKGALQPLNIDGCRIDTSESTVRNVRTAFGRLHEGREKRGGEAGTYGSSAGRWPANLILDEEAAGMLDEQSGDSTSPSKPLTGIHKHRHDTGSPPKPELLDGVLGNYGDTGGASRFFYTAKASRAERNAGCDGLPAKRAGLLQDDAYEWKGTPEHSPHKTPNATNHHPTVKPLDLMQWLCRLVTPKGGLILDPFCGSGTTGRAAVAEGFQFIGIEMNPEYAAIARARIAEYAPLFGDVA